MINLRNTREYIENFLWIRTKSAKLVKLKLKPAQIKLYNEIKRQRKLGKPIRIIILKARQLGFSTITEAILFHEAATQKNVEVAIVAQDDDSTGNLFRMTNTYLENLPQEIRPMTANTNAKEILFKNPDKKAENKGLNSNIRCYTAGGRGIGRSATIQCLHASEFAFWQHQEETWLGLVQAIPDTPDSMIIIESTPNGFDNFKKKWDDAVKGESDYAPLFFAWFENPEYRMPVPKGTVWNDEELELKKTYKLDDEQLAWRRYTLKNKCDNDKNKFHQEYPSCPEEAFIASGTGVFDNDLVAERAVKALEPLYEGEFKYKYDGLRITNIEFINKKNGRIRIYEEPREGVPYVIGGDTAGQGTDKFTGQGFDNITLNHCVTLKQTYGEVEYTRQMYCLGMYFNTALLSIENNYTTYVNNELQRLGYPRLYVTQSVSDYNKKTYTTFGYRTDKKTRPNMISEFIDLFADYPLIVRDRETLNEMLAFQYNKDYRGEAIEGEHDDLIMAMMIAHASRNQQRMTVKHKDVNKSNWTPDMIEDWERASPKERKMLEREWANVPKGGF